MLGLPNTSDCTATLNPVPSARVHRRRELERNKINVTHFLAIIERAVPSSYAFRAGRVPHQWEFQPLNDENALPSNISLAAKTTTSAGDIRNSKRHDTAAAGGGQFMAPMLSVGAAAVAQGLLCTSLYGSALMAIVAR